MPRWDSRAGKPSWRIAASGPMRRRQRVGGLSLIELLVAMTILAVLAGIGLPAFNAYVERTYRSEAHGDLLACALALERWAGVRFTYGGAADSDSDGLGDADSGLLAAEVCAPESVAANRYEVRIAGDADSFRLTAAPLAGGAMAGDGVLTLDEAGNRTWDWNNDGRIAPTEQGWEG